MTTSDAGPPSLAVLCAMIWYGSVVALLLDVRANIYGVDHLEWKTEMYKQRGRGLDQQVLYAAGETISELSSELNQYHCTCHHDSVISITS